MTRILFTAALACVLAACGRGAAVEQSTANTSSPAAPASSAKATVYGRVVADAKEVALADLVARPKEFDGQTVRVAGTVADVCAKRGCWIDVAERNGPNEVRLKVTDGEIVFPMSAKGSDAVAYGKVKVTPLDLEKTRRRAERLAKSRGEPFDPAKVTEPGSSLLIEGIGAEISGTN